MDNNKHEGEHEFKQAYTGKGGGWDSVVYMCCLHDKNGKRCPVVKRVITENGVTREEYGD